MQHVRFDIERLRVEPAEVEFSLTAADFDVADDPEYKFSWPIEGRLTGRLVGGTSVYVTGSLSTRVAVDCVRCTLGLELDVSVPIHLVFLPESEEEGVEDDGAEGEDVHVFKGDTVFPIDALREELLLALPMLPNCDSLRLPCLDPEARSASRVFGTGEEETDQPGQEARPPGAKTVSTWKEQMSRLRRDLDEGESAN
ncbi:MAG: Large ribosomal subunit accumulation protein YceD [Candidatus Sumerlaeota bacterium]|nr:Large ribosomal subunit accumulation protein YceD [Candidatus Sumerlaeota bacterium]